MLPTFHVFVTRSVAVVHAADGVLHAVSTVAARTAVHGVTDALNETNGCFADSLVRQEDHFPVCFTESLRDMSITYQLMLSDVSVPRDQDIVVIEGVSPSLSVEKVPELGAATPKDRGLAANTMHSDVRSPEP